MDVGIKSEHVNPLRESLWRGDYVFQRSSYLYPLFVERFRGARTSRCGGSHQFWEFIFIISGEGTLHYNESDSIPMIENRVFLIPPKMNHYEHSEKPLDTIWLGIYGSVFDNFPQNQLLYATNVKLIERVLDMWELAQRNYGSLGMELDGHALVILGQFQRLLKEGREDESRDVVEIAVAYLNEHFVEELSIAELTEKLNCSEGHFYRLFKQRTGKTPVQYLNQIRIQKARRWLQYTQLPVAEISSLVGYNDQFYFSRIFRKFTGKSPLRFRQVNR